MLLSLIGRPPLIATPLVRKSREEGSAIYRERTVNGIQQRVFQKEFLLTRAVSKLERRGLRVLTHHQVPTNDGGISLSQAVVAAARARHRS